MDCEHFFAPQGGIRLRRVRLTLVNFLEIAEGTQEEQ